MASDQEETDCRSDSLTLLENVQRPMTTDPNGWVLARELLADWDKLASS